MTSFQLKSIRVTFLLTENRKVLQMLLKLVMEETLEFKSTTRRNTLIVPTFDTKVTENLCSGWVFFSSDNFRLFH